jgi:hypothetical protein
MDETTREARTESYAEFDAPCNLRGSDQSDQRARQAWRKSRQLRQAPEVVRLGGAGGELIVMT